MVYLEYGLSISRHFPLLSGMYTATLTSVYVVQSLCCFRNICICCAIKKNARPNGPSLLNMTDKAILELVAETFVIL